MAENINVKIIAHIYNDFKTKFGIPRQSSLINNNAESIIIFENQYRDENAFRGLTDFSHIWLIWQFSNIKCNNWKPTVRPPRLGGNKRMGVFATRSPYRPNPIGISCVELLGVEKDEKNGLYLKVGACDLMNGTPILDIKPYLSFTDSHPSAKCGFATDIFNKNISVTFSEQAKKSLSDSQMSQLSSILCQDPRPSYQNDKERIYGMEFGQYEIKFTVNNNVLTVISVNNKQI